MTAMEKIMNLPIGHSMDWKFGLITRDVYRMSENEFDITETCGRWVNAIVTKETMQGILEDKISLLELDWE